MSNYQQIRAEALSLTTQISKGISTLSDLASNPTTAPQDEELAAKQQIDSLFGKFDSLLNDIQLMLDSQSLSHTKQTQLRRQRTQHDQLRADYTKAVQLIDYNRSRINLIDDVRNDIDQHQQAQTAAGGDAYYAQERQQVNQAHSFMDQLISQVIHTRDEMVRQRGILDSVGDRLESTLVVIPGVGDLLNRIDRRHRKNAIVLASVGFVCLVLLFFSI